LAYNSILRPAGVDWYWQNSASGTAMSDSRMIITATSAGYHYLRSYDGQCWSTRSVGRYVDPKIVQTPNTPAVSNQCGKSVLTFSGTPPAYTNWYWQTTPNGTDRSDGNQTFTVYESGTYYLRAYSGYARPYCWSDESVAVTVTVKTTPNLIITLPEVVSCSPYTIDLTAASITAGSTPSLTYSYWKDEEATILYTTPTVAVFPGIYYIKGNVANDCFVIKQAW
jgi:hypothetical protein